MKDRRWKIADFGLSAEGTSRRARTTRYARGTASYRAPELLRESGYTFTNKVDIWSLGCIVYELVTQKLAFSGDYSVLHYSSSNGNLDLPDIASMYSERSKCVLAALIYAMLGVDEHSRPSAKSILGALLATDANVGVWTSSCKHHTSQLHLGQREYGSTSTNVIVLSTDDRRWRAVRWLRHWYSP